MLFCLFNLWLFLHFHSRRHRGNVCVVPVVFSWTPYTWIQTRDKAELLVDKTIQFPTPRPLLNLHKKSYVARAENRWICSCHPTWPHERQRTIKLRSKGKAKAQGAVYVSKMLRPTFPYQRYLAPFMMVNRPARGLQLKKKQTNNKTLSTNYWPPKGPNQRKRRRRTQWTNPKEGNHQMTQKLKRRLRQLCLAILDLHN